MKKYVILFCFTLVILGATIHYSSARSADLKLTALGDSITHGTGDPSKQGYMERVKALLEKKKNVAVQISNFAVPKYTTDNILAQLDRDKINKEIKAADYLILYIGTNDFRRSAGYNFNKIDEKRMGIGEAKFTANLHKILEHLRNKNQTAPILVLGLYHPYHESEDAKKILQLIEHWNEEIHTVTNGYTQTYFVPTLDLFTTNNHFSDALHPNSAGYQLIADRLYEVMLKLDG
ncbi:GDSL-type esterase/lipase family protein [Bacillus sp. B15-48]|uniref:GDSL-type esterase/lipase family protein n=1 Tax=Bacillus sp. B15-48 TaxID=1548601 RepID=UPI00193FA802|nr:GDSL-type esterase/lipase family protein [Bacillus sp. B15-48]